MSADILLFIILCLALFLGWRSGTINVLASLGSIVLAYRLGRLFSAPLAQKLTEMLPVLSPSHGNGTVTNLLSLFIDTTTAANFLVQLICFIIIFIVVRWLVRKLARVLTGAFGGGLLGKINKAIGAVLALLLCAVVIVIFTDIILPAFARMGFGTAALAFLRQSRYVLPFFQSLQALL